MGDLGKVEVKINPNLFERVRKMDGFVSISALYMLPTGSLVRLDHNVLNMDNQPRTMIVWRWKDNIADGGGVRISHFDLETGSYEGEACIE